MSDNDKRRSTGRALCSMVRKPIHPSSTLKSHHTIIHGDSRQMNLLADRSVHLVVTSPPYWQLKDYGTENQIGFHESYESYINNLNLVWNECERATLQSPPK